MAKAKIPAPITPSGRIRDIWHIQQTASNRLQATLNVLSLEGWQIFAILDKAQQPNAYTKVSRTDWLVVAVKRQMTF